MDLLQAAANAVTQIVTTDTWRQVKLMVSGSRAVHSGHAERAGGRRGKLRARMLGARADGGTAAEQALVEALRGLDQAFAPSSGQAGTTVMVGTSYGPGPISQTGQIIHIRP